MPSIKACLASLVVALTLIPSTVASVVPGHELATKRGLVRAQHHAARHLPASPRAVFRRSRNAKAVKPIKAAAVSNGRGKPVAVSNGQGKPSAAQQQAASALDPYSPNGVFLNSNLATSAATRRCGLDITCQKSVTVPAHATAFCIAGHCTFRCDSPAFAPSGTQCAAAPSQCPNTPGTCPAVAGGFTSCDANGACAANCQADQGFTLHTNASGGFVCLNLNVDAANCGAAGNFCPQSYNGVGTPKCKASTCTLACPSGQSPHKTTSTGATFCSA